MGVRLSIEGSESIKLQETSITGIEFGADIPHDSNARSTDLGSTVLITGKILAAVDGETADEQLSDREKDVIIALVQGMSNKEIADHLFISVNTVITHRRNIARKLQIHSPAGLTIYAIVNDLVDISTVKL